MGPAHPTPACDPRGQGPLLRVSGAVEVASSPGAGWTARGLRQRPEFWCTEPEFSPVARRLRVEPARLSAEPDWAEIDEIKRCLLLGRKVMTNLDSVFKSRDITLPR